MNDTKTMLRAIINGQSALKEELLKKIEGVDKKLSSDIGGLRTEMKMGFKKVNDRLDKQGKSLAYLEDDAPTREEHDVLEKRVAKVEEKVASI